MESIAEQLLSWYIPSADRVFWSNLVATPLSKDDVWLFLSTDYIRTLKQKMPWNLAILILESFRPIAAATSEIFNPTIVINCVRFLTRIIPIIIEQRSADGFYENLFFKNVLPDWDGADPESKEAGTSIAAGLPLAQQIVLALSKLLFIDNFTISGNQATWESAGIGSEPFYPSQVTKFDENRADILKCLLCCCCSPLYTTPEKFLHDENIWLSFLVSDNPCISQIFFSLFNMICNFFPSSTFLPYSHSFSSDARDLLVDVALQFTLVTLDYRTIQTDETPKINDFRNCLFSIVDEPSLEIIYKSLTRILCNSYQANNTYLPGSIRQVGCFQEVFILFWKLLDENEAFLSFVANQVDLSDLLLPLTYFMFIYRKDASKLGLVHTCTFILLRLSSERAFGVALNNPYTGTLPIDLSLFDCSLADLLIVVSTKLLVNSQHHLESILNVILTVLANISPYITKLSLTSSIKLIKLAELLASPKFLFAGKDNHKYLFLLLEVLNNFIQYQQVGSARLIYAICRKAKFFRDMAVITEKFPTGDKFKPTLEWQAEWKTKLPIRTINALLEFLVPKIEVLVEKNHADDTTIFEYIGKTTLVGVVPLPQAILWRKFHRSSFTDLWFTTFLFGVIFLRNQLYPLFDGSKITLFSVE